MTHTLNHMDLPVSGESTGRWAYVTILGQPGPVGRDPRPGSRLEPWESQSGECKLACVFIFHGELMNHP